VLASKFGDLSSVPESGIDLEGVHYIVPLTEEGLIFGKKGKSGFFAIKTQSCKSFPRWSHPTP
jgi:profilin